jgi:amino acid transporter
VKQPGRPARGLSRVIGSGPVLLLAFAFAVMADPVSSVAYAVEAALRALDGNLALLIPTMGLVVAIIAMVIVNYQQIIARYPGGGGASAAVGEAFGEGVAFLPIGSLIVDFVLTIAISVSAGASAVIAYFPSLAPWRLEIAVGLVLVVGGITWFGHLGRIVFAIMALSFVLVASLVLIFGMTAQPISGDPVTSVTSGGGVLAVVLAFPVAMALATGVEAPSSAIAQLGGLGDARRKLFGRVTLWLTLAIVGTITMGLAIEATVLRIGVPSPDTTMIAELARHVAPAPVFAAFQLVTALLLLAAASSSFQAGPGLLKALATQGDGGAGIVPRHFGLTNSRFTPYWGVVLFAALAAGVVAVAGGNDQVLVLFYAVAVFLSFLSGLLAMAVFSARDRRWGMLVLNVVGAVVVAFTLIVNLGRGYPLVSLAAAFLVGGTLFLLWLRAGRPGGVRDIAARAEADAEQL